MIRSSSPSNQFVQSRELQADDEDPNAEEEEPNTGSGLNDGSKLRDTFVVFLTIFVVVVILYSWLRRKYPKVYNVRNVITELKTYLAEDQHGFISWAWKVHAVSEDELLEECGMDATCYVRILAMGFRISVVGIFNMVWLLPVYFTGYNGEGDTNADRIYQTTISHLPPGDPRLLGAVFASYIMFGYAMYILLKEFEWYISLRHRFLKKPLPHHYAIFVRSIPHEYRSDRRLAAYFEKCFSKDAVLEARMVVNTPGLSKTVKEREATLAHLEHALALYKKNGSRPRHKINLLGITGEEVDSIEYYSDRLKEENRHVTEKLEALTQLIKSIKEQESAAMQSLQLEHISQDEAGISGSGTAMLLAIESPSDSIRDHNIPPVEEDIPIPPSPEPGRSPFSPGKIFNTTTNAAAKVTSAATKATVQVTNHVTTGVTNIAAEAVAYVLPGEEGEMLRSGFVVFKKLNTVNAALQMIHNARPFGMRVLEAPDPKFIVWGNTSRATKDLQLGMLASFSLTAVLCVFWTVPTAFFGSLSNSAAVREDLPGLDDFFNKYPGMVPLFEQLAPFLLVILNTFLPPIFQWITLFEGQVSTGAVEASKFVKLGSFNIIQTFFVSALSGGVVQGLSYMLDDPSNIVNYMASTLPAQSVYFQQIIIVQTVTNAGMELIRVTPLVLAALRSCIGPRLTEKERNQPFIGLRPLSNPIKFSQAYFGAQMVLFFLILFVYAPISPLTPLLMAPCFLVMMSVSRHQFIYIYPTEPDSGGKLWAKFVHFYLACMLMAQLTIVGLLGLKKAPLEIGLFVPLIIITFLFILYICQRHFLVARYLPTGDCIEMDEERAHDFSFSFVEGAYMQPSLAAKKVVQPDPSDFPEGQVQEPKGHDPSAQPGQSNV